MDTLGDVVARLLLLVARCIPASVVVQQHRDHSRNVTKGGGGATEKGRKKAKIKLHKRAWY